MPAVFVQAAGVHSNGIAATATFPSPPAAGNLLIASLAEFAGGFTPTLTSAGWTALTNLSTASVTERMFWKIAGASEPQAVSYNFSSDGILAIAEYTGLASWTVSAQNAAITTPSFPATPSVTPATGRPAVAVCMIAEYRSGIVFSSVNINGAPANVRVAAGPSTTCAVLFDQLVSSTSGSYQGTATPSLVASDATGAIAVIAGAASGSAGMLL